MDDLDHGPVPPPLRREVESPQRQPSGLGVMLLASASMFFAVAGSAFILRARMSDGCPYRGAASPAEVRGHGERRASGRRTAPPPPSLRSTAPAPTIDCDVVRRIGTNGEQLVVFPLCPD